MDFNSSDMLGTKKIKKISQKNLYEFIVTLMEYTVHDVMNAGKPSINTSIRKFYKLQSYKDVNSFFNAAKSCIFTLKKKIDNSDKKYDF